MAETSKQSGGEAGPLEEFLGAAEAFVKNVSAARIKAAGRHPDAILLQGNSRIVAAQFGRVCEEVRRLYRDTHVAARRDADELLAVQQGALLARIGEETALAALAAGPGGGFFAWLSQHLEEIKKLIRFIVGSLGITLPGWLETLLLLIDELFDAENGILSGILGFNRREIADEISARAVNTMNELAALARLTAAGRGAGGEEASD